ncbi:sodium channel subunit beta-4-like [Engraulis encrasicolus]|uniref:sodium channel subunit beta-4-like n=1 Tax=Engraulis encrasicolus TaxID=184585 RepID=UPI002FCEB88A
MEPGEQQRRWFFHRCRTSGDMKGVSILVALLLGAWGAQALEMSVGKVTTIEALYGSSVQLPCSYTSCDDIENVVFYWGFNDSYSNLMRCLISRQGADPDVDIYYMYRDRVEFVGNPNYNDLSIMIHNLTFEDAGDYVCSGTKEDRRQRYTYHSATVTLNVVDELNLNLTVIIMSVVGAVIGILALIKGIKSLVTRFILDENKVPLVSSTGNDNTADDLSGSKADDKPEAQA